jgi:hypothetical protein
VTITVVPGPVAGLSLTIDGQPVPPTWDGPRELDPGAHEVVAHAPGFHQANAHFWLTGGGSDSVTLLLTPLPKVAGVRPLLPPSVAPPPPVQPTPPAQSTPPPDRTLPTALMAAGGGTLVVGLVVGLVGVTEAGRATTRDGAEAGAARAKAITGDALAGAGAAAAGAGLVILLVQRRSQVPAAAVVTPWARGLVGGFAVHF